MARMPDYALMYIRVTIPDTHSAEQVAEEVRRSISFGQPSVRLLGMFSLEQETKDDDPIIVWIPLGSPDVSSMFPEEPGNEV